MNTLTMLISIPSSSGVYFKYYSLQTNYKCYLLTN